MIIKLKAIIFDMDGVITNTMPYHYRAWKIVFKKIGIPVTHNDVYLREGQTGTKALEEIFYKYGVPFSNKEARSVLKSKEDLFKEIVKLRYIPGSRNFLRSLHNRNIRLALVTGTSRHELHQILPDDIYNLFDVVVTGSDVKNGKPHPEPYSKAIKKLKISSSQAVAIENAPLGIRSAQKAGLRCFALETSLPKEYIKDAEQVFKTIKMLRNRIEFQLS